MTVVIKAAHFKENIGPIHFFQPQNLDSSRHSVSRKQLNSKHGSQ